LRVHRGPENFEIDRRVLKLGAGGGHKRTGCGCQHGERDGGLHQTRGPLALSVAEATANAIAIAEGSSLAWANAHENLRGQEPRTSRPHLVAQLISSTGTPIYISVEIRVKAGILICGGSGRSPSLAAVSWPDGSSGFGRPVATRRRWGCA